MNNTKYIFTIGYNLGRDNKRDYSYREVQSMFPYFSDSDIRICLNGADDGAAGDKFRLNLLNGSDYD
jgi:hypothetical protein